MWFRQKGDTLGIFFFNYKTKLTHLGIMPSDYILEMLMHYLIILQNVREHQMLQSQLNQPFPNL